uniref:AGC-kinase C-terminal domain-containing protein n=1 Tax=Panagrellus redivivus TaxID=6233 RepID=A0A7E4VFN6_PANRE
MVLDGKRPNSISTASELTSGTDHACALSPGVNDPETASLSGFDDTLLDEKPVFSVPPPPPYPPPGTPRKVRFSFDEDAQKTPTSGNRHQFIDPTGQEMRVFTFPEVEDFRRISTTDLEDVFDEEDTHSVSSYVTAPASPEGSEAPGSDDDWTEDFSKELWLQQSGLINKTMYVEHLRTRAS